jgi:perosamine synthetase
MDPPSAVDRRESWRTSRRSRVLCQKPSRSGHDDQLLLRNAFHLPENLPMAHHTDGSSSLSATLPSRRTRSRGRLTTKVLEELAIEGGQPVIPPGRHRTWPDIRAEDYDAINAVLRRGELWGANGTEVSALQNEWARYVGTKHCLAVNSGTAALHCAVVGVGVVPRDEVIVPAFSFIATPMAVLHAGAVPVFCDIESSTFNIDVAKIEERITPRTKAIMPVHMHGVVADMDEIQSIADRHGLSLIEDAAQAHGSKYKGRNAGTLGACAAFSLNGAKNLSAGEGGLFVTDDERTFVAARRLAIFGEDTPRLERGEFRAFWSHGIGWNYRTHELTAALARSQLRRLDSYNETARRNAAVLTDGLERVPGFLPPAIPNDRVSCFHRYRVRFEPSELGFNGPPLELRDRLLYVLRAEGVAVSTWQTLPLPSSPVFRRGHFAAWRQDLDDDHLERWDPQEYPEATRLLEQSLVLGPELEPLYVQSTELMECYVEAFDKVISRMDVVLAADYEPLRVRPAIPADSL